MYSTPFLLTRIDIKPSMHKNHMPSEMWEVLTYIIPQ